MHLRAVFVPAAILLAAALVFGCAKKKEEPKPPAPSLTPPAAPGDPVAEGMVIFGQKCGVCHGVDRAISRTETKAKWAEIVKSMQEKKADWISDAEAAKIVEFLAAKYGKK